jgi:hypothetical protein
LRSRFYDAQSGRFLRKDNYQGRQSEPLTLHKYSYTHNNPVNGTDPTGLFMMAEFAAAESIRNILAGIQATSGGYLISATLNNGDYGLREFLTDTAWNAAFAFLPTVLYSVGQKRLGGIAPIGGKGPITGRPFEPGAAGGAIRKLSMRNVKITHTGVDRVERHLREFILPSEGQLNPGNQVMLSRLRGIASGSVSPTQVDLNFYTHELREGFRYQKLGIRPGNYPPPGSDEANRIWNNTHTATLEDYGIVTDNDLYSREALQAMEKYYLNMYGLR